MRAFLHMGSLAAIAALTVTTFAPTAQARLLFSNDTDYTKGDTFVIDFDDNADGEITLEFGDVASQGGTISYNSGDAMFTVEESLSVLGDYLSVDSDVTTLSGFWEAEIGELEEQVTNNDFNLTALNNITDYSLSGIIYALDEAIDNVSVGGTVDDGRLEIATEGDTFSGAIVAHDLHFQFLSGYVENLSGAIAYQSGLIETINNTTSYQSGYLESLSGVTQYQSGLLNDIINSIGTGVINDNRLTVADPWDTFSGAIVDHDLAISANSDQITDNSAVIAYHSGLFEDITDGSYDIDINTTYNNFTMPGTLSGLLGEIDDAIDGAGGTFDRGESIVRIPEFDGVTFVETNAGSDTSRGRMESVNDTDGAAYVWSSRRVSDQSITVIGSVQLPDDFESLSGSTNQLQIDLKTARTDDDGTILGASAGVADAFIDVEVENLSNGDGVVGSATNLNTASAVAAESNVTVTPVTTWQPGDVIELRFEMHANRDGSDRGAAYLHGFSLDYIGNFENNQL